MNTDILLISIIGMLIFAILAQTGFSFWRERRAVLDARDQHKETMKLAEDSVKALGAQFERQSAALKAYFDADREKLELRVERAYAQADALFQKNQALLEQLTEQAHQIGASQAAVSHVRTELDIARTEALNSQPTPKQRRGQMRSTLFDNDRFEDSPTEANAVGDMG